jgi:hypothetical protein
MRDLSFQTFFERFVPTIGKSPDEFPCGSVDGERHCAAISAAVRIAHEHDFWPELLVIEARTPDSEGVILQNETGKTPIDTVQGFFATEDNARGFCTPLSAARIPEGWRLTFPPASAYVRYRPVAPSFTRVKWDNARTYAVNDVVYLETSGMCYRCILAGAGEYPETETDYWVEQPFPGLFEVYAQYSAGAANWRFERQWSQAGEMQSKADAELFRLKNIAKNQGGRL